MIAEHRQTEHRPVVTNKRKIRVLVVDDSELMRREISRGLRANRRISVVGTAENGEQARELARELNPDVITLDVNMPGMDGLTCLQYIMIENPTPCVIVSALTDESAIETFEAYELGAVAVVEKPRQSKGEPLQLFKRRLAANIIRASHVDMENLTRAELSAAVGPKSRQVPMVDQQPEGRIARRVVVIGASTGGPRTLMDVIPGLPPNLGAAVIVIQHMPGSFTGAYARRLNDYSQLPVHEARQGELVIENHVYIAPGDYNLSIKRTGTGHRSEIVLEEGSGDEFIVPSFDVALDSVIEVYGKRTCGVVLTGLGNDGAKAMARLHGMGGTTIAESEISAVIYGMPKAVVDLKAASRIVPSRKVAEAIVETMPRANGDDDAPENSRE